MSQNNETPPELIAVPKPLYHYCTLDGLKGIIENNCLWMSNLFWMDDATEYFWFIEVLNSLVKELPEEDRGVPPSN